MKAIVAIAGLGLVCGLFAPTPGAARRADAAEPPGDPAPPGTVERAAMGKVDFLVGDWEGEGWSTPPSGERRRFWVKESYRYRGDKDLMDMEGRFGSILPDGTRAPEREYDLGILYFDRGSGEYRMWHYGSLESVMTATMDVDIEGRSMEYTTEYAPGRTGRFHLSIGDDHVWVSTFEILTQEKTWRKVMEFRMRLVAKGP